MSQGKIEQSELEALKAQEQKGSALINELANVKLAESDIVSALKDLRSERQKLFDELKEKYGPINININDGSYEVDEAPEVEVEEA
mgnify:CR=1 FL=1